jgi:hypothetical protein
MTWLRPVDRTSGTLTLNAGTLSCLAHHGTPLSERCPTTAALERTIVPMDDAERMPPLGAVKPRQKFFDVIHRAQFSKNESAPNSVGLRARAPKPQPRYTATAPKPEQPREHPLAQLVAALRQAWIDENVRR